MRKQLRSKGISFSSIKNLRSCTRDDSQSTGDIRLAVVRRPFDEALVNETPGAVLRIDLHQHVGIGIVSSGSHDVVLRTVVAVVVHPLVLVTRNDKLNCVLVFAQKRMQTVIGELGWLVLNEWIVDKD